MFSAPTAASLPATLPDSDAATKSILPSFSSTQSKPGTQQHSRAVAKADVRALQQEAMRIRKETLQQEKEQSNEQIGANQANTTQEHQTK